MTRKVIFLLILLASTSVITGCKEFYRYSSPYFPIDKKETILLSEKDARWMRRRDYARLKIFIETALPNEPKENVRWYSRIYRYTVSSQYIFVNKETGQPCRCYNIERKPLFARPTDHMEVACRNTKGQWIKTINH